MTLEGYTALSVEMSTMRSTPWRPQDSEMQRVPNTLFCTASLTFTSIMGTCLCAAAWKTTLGRCSLKIWLMRTSSETEPMVT